MLSGVLCIAGGIALLAILGAPDVAYAADAAFAPLRGGFFEGQNVAPANLLELELGVSLPLFAGGLLVAGACFVVRSTSLEDRAAWAAGALACPLLAAPVLSASHVGWFGDFHPLIPLLLAGGAIFLVLTFVVVLACAVFGTTDFLEEEYPEYDRESEWRSTIGGDGCGGGCGCGD